MNSIDNKIIEQILNKYIQLLNDLQIFNINANNLYKNKKTIINDILKNIKRKNNMSGLTNLIHPEKTQFNNIAGFEPVYNNAGQLHSNFIKSKIPKKRFNIIYKDKGYNHSKIKEEWHKDILRVLKFFHFYKNEKLDYIVTSMNEEWHDYKVGSGDEFVTLINNKKELLNKNNLKKNKLSKIKFLGNVVKPITNKTECDNSDLSNLIRHRIYKINNIIIINIHTASNINGIVASDNIIMVK